MKQASDQTQLISSPPSGQLRHSRAVKTLGILQIILAVLGVMFGTFTIFWGGPVAIYCSPIWTGLLLALPAGILGVVSIKSRPDRVKCLAIATLVMSILAAVGSGIVITLYSLEAGSGFFAPVYLYGGPFSLDILTVVFGLAELVVSVTASAYSCCVIGHANTNVNTTINHIPQQTYLYSSPQQQYVPAVLNYPQQQVPAYNVYSMTPNNPPATETAPAVTGSQAYNVFV